MNSKKKKRIIIGIIIVVVLVLIVGKIIKAKNAPVEPDFDVGTIEKQTLRNSISCSGNLRTEESKNVTSVLVGSKITGVNVQVGDQVEVGDSLLTFETDTLRKSAGDLASSIKATKEQSNISINSADRAVRDAENARSDSLNQLREAKDTAQKSLDDTVNSYNNAINQLNSLETQMAGLDGSIVSQYETAKNDVTAKQNAYNAAEKAYNDAVEKETNGEQLTGGVTVAGLQIAKDTANSELLTSKAALSALEPKYQQYNTEKTALTGKLTTIRETVGKLQGAMEQARTAVDQANRNYDSSSSKLDSALLSAQDAAASARIGAGTSTLSLEEQLMATNKQLAEGNLKSTVSGTVTSVTAKKGDTYQGGTLLTIEGVDSFIVEANIDEYDVADIKEGMEAIIKTDATRDEELKGKVIFVAPASNETSTSSGVSGSITGSTGSTATYAVKIEVLTPSDRLRLGMSAKVSIITEKAEDVLTVPYDAITVKDDGKKVITVINEDETQTEIEVEVGLESGYYSEIKSDKIKEGMKVVLPKVNGTSTLDDLLESMGATGGIE